MTMPEEVKFTSHNTTCRGDLYRPPGVVGDRPCIVMAHGFGATRTCGLAPYAEAFVAAGYVVLAFDYRSFGTSEGEPRRVLLPHRQVEDWLAAAAFVRGLDGVQPDAIAFWGTSFAGGLVTAAAARDRDVQAVVAQCPLMDGRAAVLEAVRYDGIGHVLRLTGHATLDLLGAALGRPPHRIASAGRPGSVAAMTAPDCADGYATLVPAGVETDVAARVIALLGTFRPVRSAAKVTCPVLVQICDTDTVAPTAAAEQAAGRMAQADVRHYDCGHFDIYQGHLRDRSIADQLDFLRTHLCPTSAESGHASVESST